MGYVRSFGILAAAASLLAACGSSSKGSTAAKGDASTGDDAGEEAGEAGDEAAGPAGYPAFTVDAPQILKHQGGVLASPVVVTITWPGDTNAASYEGFGDALGASSYWTATTSQYGVGPATSGAANHVQMNQPLPSSMSYDDVTSFVTAAVQAATSDGGVGGEAGAPDAGEPDPVWPAPVLGAKGQAQTIYSLFIPVSTSVTDPGSGQSFCDLGALGYHDEVSTPGGVGVAFAVTLECPTLSLALNEETAAHESIEAATDPYVEYGPPGFYGFDANHLAWDLYTGYNDELSDACENWQDSYYEESASFPYWVQRSWSNSGALAGHDPCAPATAGAYHGMTLFPSQESTIKINASALGNPASTTKGFKATVGQAMTFQVGFYSDASTTPWKIAYDFPSDLADDMGNSVSNGKATVKIDKTTGQNGDLANVTVTVTTKAPSGFHVMAITWDPPTSEEFLPHYLPLIILDE
ncbi:MAG TPA: hypothetical protein VGL81_27120 [Polyangiaceae bacterium]|jgi:hypothetical protein